VSRHGIAVWHDGSSRYSLSGTTRIQSARRLGAETVRAAEIKNEPDRDRASVFRLNSALDSLK
jgi:uncharacterized ParB-like nuclease family protein